MYYFIILAGFVIWRFNKNFDEFTRAVAKEYYCFVIFNRKIYDVRRANEQLKLYKELYNTEGLQENNPRVNKLMKVASEEDKVKINEIFTKYEDLGDDEIKTQMDYVKSKNTKYIL